MTLFRFAPLIALALALAPVGPARAGAPGSNNRLADLEAICEGGGSSGLGCTSSADCPNGRCQIVPDGTATRALPFLATVIVDDDTGEWNDDEQIDDIHTVTVLLEFISQGRRQMLAQNYMNVKGEDAEALLENMRQGVEIADLPNSNRRLDETLANGAVRDWGIIDDFLFQRPDSTMEQRLREYFHTTGNFVVARNRGLRIWSDEEASPLATVFQVRLDVVVTAE